MEYLNEKLFNLEHLQQQINSLALKEILTEIGGFIRDSLEGWLRIEGKGQHFIKIIFTIYDKISNIELN